MNQYLLPSGFRDLLPPDARLEQQLMTEILECFYRFGYDQVSPPLIEFEETLLAGKGKAYDPYTFRVMDPLSHKMMGIRADMTMQISRIAASRLASAPLPLRLSYAGRVLRVLPEDLTTDRQFSQAGIELIGSTNIAAEVEVILACVEALEAQGFTYLVIDFSLGHMLEKLLAESPSLSAEQCEEIIRSVEQKNADRLAEAWPGMASIKTLLEMPSNPAQAFVTLRSLALPASVQAQVDALAETVARVKEAAPSLVLTVDVLERQGLDYYDGVCFAIFDAASRQEIARGGRYSMQNAAGEFLPATGATIYLRALMHAGTYSATASKIFLPHGTSRETAIRLRKEGYRTVLGLDPAEDIKKVAVQQGCSVYWDGGAIRTLVTA